MTMVTLKSKSKTTKAVVASGSSGAWWYASGTERWLVVFTAQTTV
jgi:hypothetical protein